MMVWGSLAYGLHGPEYRSILQWRRVDLGVVVEPKKPWASSGCSVQAVSAWTGLHQVHLLEAWWRRQPAGLARGLGNPQAPEAIRGVCLGEGNRPCWHVASETLEPLKPSEEFVFLRQSRA
ncbi:hypothetical protein SORBI_3001G037150 [Sorghum bicolor]|uniref:Uncharacterized protein n=1 Tax=Sorghum bicolor TaxID=4558 RepID=A0A1Z5S470_SORBI|nr:hypothetical protein SORBI_3001G037150 [Sorghum bicolor]